jgi:hypothetical protein
VATNTSTSNTSTTAVVVPASAEAALIESNALEALKQAYKHQQAELTQHEDIRKQAEAAKQTAAVWMARIAHRVATHPAVATSRYPYNITGAAKALDVPISTFRPYALAGEVLGRKDRAGLLSVPALEDITIVEKSFDATTRAEQKAKRVKAAAKQAQLEAKAKELEALKAKQGGTPAAPAGTPAAPAGAPATAGTPATAGAPAGAPAAPAGPSVTDDILRTARELVKMSKAQRANDKQAWAKTHGELVKVLVELFPGLKV